jgi:hypothetical protein
MSSIHLAPNPFIPPWLPPVAWTPWDELYSYDDIAALNITGYPYGVVPIDYQVRLGPQLLMLIILNETITT